MSASAICKVLESKHSSGIYRLAMLAVADGGGSCGIKQIQRWCNTDEDGARLVANDLVELGALRETRNPFGELSFYSEWLSDPQAKTRESDEKSRYIPKSVRDQVAEACGYSCAYCGATGVDFHIDRIHPFSRGGTNDPENLTLACGPCNISKGDKTVEVWGRRRQ